MTSDVLGPYLTIDGLEPTIHAELILLDLSSGFDVVGGADNADGLSVIGHPGFPGIGGYMDGAYSTHMTSGARPNSAIATIDYNGNGHSMVFDDVTGSLIFEEGEALFADQIYINGIRADLGGTSHLPAYSSSGIESWPSVNLVTIPEPGTALLLGIGLAMLTRRRSLQ